MKHLFIFSILSLFVVSCNKYDMPRVPDPPAYGTISFNEVPDYPTTTTITNKSNLKTLYVYSVICAPTAQGLQTRIFAWNRAYGQECRTLVMVVSGGSSGFLLENPNVFMSYSRNLIQYGFGLIDNTVSPAQMNKDYVPPFALTKSEFELNTTATVPITFSEFNANVPSNERKIKASVPSLLIGQTNLENFNINIESFGGVLTSTQKCMTFDLNGIPSGSFDSQPSNAIGFDKKPGVSTLTASFNPSQNNSLVSLTFDFVHHSSKLAYTGPVGKYDLSDGTGYTEIKITAVDQNGVVYREQKGKGFLRVLYEKPWQLLITFPTNSKFPGDLLMEFEAELMSESGEKMTITNGNAYYTISDF